MKWFDTVVSTTREILEASGRADCCNAGPVRRVGVHPPAADVAVVTFSAASTSAEQPTAAAQSAELEHAA